MPDDLAALLGGKKGGSKPRARKTLAQQLAPPTPDPLAGIQYEGDIAADSQLELDALAQGFRDRAAREQDRLTDAMDSQFWVTLCFRTRDDVDTFLRRLHLDALGNKYIDGHKAAVVLGVDMTRPGGNT